jgi:uncharacterized protein YegJ (DUF2314 family)
MKSRGGAALALSVALAVYGCSRTTQQPDPRDSSIHVPEHDPEMDAAVAKARSEVATFIARLQKPLPGDDFFSVKMPIQQEEGTEHFWLAGVTYDRGVFRGTLANDPDIVKGHRFGERVSIKEAEISDWMFAHDGVLVGGFTIRLLRSRMSPTERAQMDKEMQIRVE